MSAKKSRLHYELREFTEESMAATEAAWAKVLASHSSDLLPGEFTRILAWTRSRLSATSPTETLAYGVFASDRAHALAIAEIVYTKAGRKWLKMLDLHLSPELDLSMSSGAPDLWTISGVFSEAIVGTTRLTRVHVTNVVKLYARSTSLLTFFKGLAATIGAAGDNEAIDVSIEGRWLVIKTK